MNAPLETLEARYSDLLSRLGVTGHSGAVAEITALRMRAGLEDRRGDSLQNCLKILEQFSKGRSSDGAGVFLGDGVHPPVRSEDLRLLLLELQRRRAQDGT